MNLISVRFISLLIIIVPSNLILLASLSRTFRHGA
jgi:hypothetical protein